MASKLFARVLYKLLILGIFSLLHKTIKIFPFDTPFTAYLVCWQWIFLSVNPVPNSVYTHFKKLRDVLNSQIGFIHPYTSFFLTLYTELVLTVYTLAYVSHCQVY